MSVNIYLKKTLFFTHWKWLLCIFLSAVHSNERDHAPARLCGVFKKNDVMNSTNLKNGRFLKSTNEIICAVFNAEWKCRLTC